MWVSAFCLFETASELVFFVEVGFSIWILVYILKVLWSVSVFIICVCVFFRIMIGFSPFDISLSEYAIFLSSGCQHWVVFFWFWPFFPPPLTVVDYKLLTPLADDYSTIFFPNPIVLSVSRLVGVVTLWSLVCFQLTIGRVQIISSRANRTSFNATTAFVWRATNSAMASLTA